MHMLVTHKLQSKDNIQAWTTPFSGVFAGEGNQWESQEQIRECSRTSNRDEKLKAKLQSMFALRCSYTLSDQIMCCK